MAPGRRLAAVRAAAAATDADDSAEVIFDRGVAFTRAALETNAVHDLDDSAARADQALVLEYSRHRVDGGALRPKQSGERFLSQLDAAAGTVLGRQ